MRLGATKDWVKNRLNGTVTLAADDLVRIAAVLELDPGVFFRPRATAARQARPSLLELASGEGDDERIDLLLLQILDRLVAAWRDLPEVELETLRGIFRRRQARRARCTGPVDADASPAGEPMRPAE